MAAPHHDTGYKMLFSYPEMVHELLKDFVRDDWLQSLDYSTLEKVPGSYISEDLRNRADDVVWRVKVGGGWVYLYLLIEFQSTVDKYMALRMMVYQGLLYQDLIKRGDVLAAGKLPPILPIVLYNGTQRWTAAKNVAELIPPVPGLVEQFKPHAKYLLIDENAYTDSHLASLKNLVAAVFRIERPESPAVVSELVGLLGEWLKDRPDLSRMFAIWIRATLMSKPGYGIVLPQLDNLQELKVMLAERLEQWAKGYVAEGEQRGLMLGEQRGEQRGLMLGEQRGEQRGLMLGEQRGEALLLQKMLAKRFGALPAPVIAKIDSAAPAQIEAWSDLIFDAPSLDAIFGPTLN